MPLQPIRWQVARVLPNDWPDIQPRVMEIEIVARWEEDISGVKGCRAEFNGWLPWRPDVTMAEIEETARRQVRERLSRLAESLAGVPQK